MMGAQKYVRINDCEGTVTELSLFVTRLRTGMGEEIAIPNALVAGNVTRNFSRIRNSAGRSGYVLDTTVTIGYDTPWRQVHSMLIEAASNPVPPCADQSGQNRSAWWSGSPTIRLEALRESYSNPLAVARLQCQS